MRPHEYGRAAAYVPSPNDAPIYNDQLQNLDMELKILERQREIIKQKQKETFMISQRQNVYNQPSSSYGHHESKQNTASSYQRKGKRPFEGNWQNQTSAKKSRINPWEPLYDNPSQNPRPLMKIHTNQYKSNIPKNKPKQRTDFKSANVVRIRDYVPKNSTDFKSANVVRIRDYVPKNSNVRDSVPKKSNVRDSVPKKSNANSNVPKTANNSTSVSNKKKNVYTKEILRPFVEPSRSMRGRLELALGDITKQLKQSKSLDAPTLEQFQTPAAQRQVKNIIRQRISSVMMNKLVGTAADILVHYRKKYPNDVDEEILKAIKSAPPKFADRPLFVNPITTEESDKIRAFFKSKMSELLNDKMTEMISKLSSIYGDYESEILKCLEDLPDIENIANEENKSEVDDKKEIKENQDEVEEQKDSIESDNVDAKTDSIESDNADAEKDGIEGDNADANKDSIESDNADAVKDGIEGDNADANKDSIESDNVGTEKKSANETMTIDVDKETNVETAKKKPEKSNKVDQYYKLMDLLITKRLPVIMEKFKKDFVKLMYSDKDFIEARQFILEETRRMLKKAFTIANEGRMPKTESAEEKPGHQEDKKDTANSTSTEKSEPRKETDDKKETASSTTTPKSGQLYVMLLGRPSLPPKPVIYEFLNKFKPQSIKKHKTVNNLLVIGFNNEDDYNNILAANESKVGDATFIIKANEVIAAEKQNESPAAVDKESDEKGKKVTSEATHQDIKETDTNEQDVIEVNEENNESLKDKNDQDIIDISDEKSQDGQENADVNMETIPEAVEENAANDVQETAIVTPTRSSSRLANIAPSTIKTRRASRLAQ